MIHLYVDLNDNPLWESTQKRIENKELTKGCMPKCIRRVFQTIAGLIYLGAGLLVLLWLFLNYGMM